MYLKYSKLILTLLLASAFSAQAQQKVEYITSSGVYYDSILYDVDTCVLYYSNGRGGIAVSGIYGPFATHKQPLMFDSAKNISSGYGHASLLEGVRKTYNSNGLLDTLFWNDGYINERTTYLYNSAQQLVSTTFFNYNYPNTIKGGYNDTNIYDNNGLLVALIRTQWSVLSSTYEPDYRYDYMYNTTGQLEEVVYKVWNKNTSAYEVNSRTKNYYSGNLPDSTYYYQYFSTKEQLTKNYFTYNGTLIETNAIIKYSDTLQPPIDKKRVRYTYNSSSQQDSIFSEKWDNNTSTWSAYALTRQTYNIHGKVDSMIYFNYDYNSNTYTYSLLNYIHYDTNGNFMYQTSKGSLKYPDTLVVYHYNQLPTKVPDVVKKFNREINIYPNPATSVINVQLNSSGGRSNRVAVYSIDGSLVRERYTGKNVAKDVQIPIADLPAGNYLLHVTGLEFDKTKTFTIMR